jgi:quinohemoprotein amine dehydrogenase
VSCLAGLLAAGQDPPKPAEPQKPTEDGIPVTSQLVVDKCGGCHKQDEKKNLTRISWERATPEAWQQAIKRMVRLSGVSLTPDEARQIVRYLSNNHGLAPEEARPVMYMAERRMIDETVPEDVREACVICHPHGRAASWRRTKEEWNLLIAMHSGYFPVVEFQGFRRFPQPPNAPPPAPGTDTRDPADRAVEFLAKTFPLQTPEWSSWRASMRTPKLAGRWLLTGSQTGRGPVMGEVVIEPTTESDEFTTRARITFVRDGSTITTTGRSIVYTGYAWRGRSKNTGASSGPEQLKEAREVMLVSRDQSQMDGRWFWGGYDEFGLNVTLRRAGSDPVVLATDRTALRSGSTGVRVRISGDNFPADLKADDIDFGGGVQVRRVVSQAATDVTVELDVAADALPGKRDVAVRRAVASGAAAVYDHIDYLKVLPQASLARLGGNTHPKGYEHFEAHAYTRGPDGKTNTADDVDLGIVDAEWSTEEFLATYGDDDKEFVGTISQTGLFTPSTEGPNPKRKFGRNNYGDVWAVATYKPKSGEMARDGRPATGRGHLVVSIPLYVRWDTPEVSQ